MIVGFTGTQKGMTARQKTDFADWLPRLDALQFHHGDCIGADAEAHDVADDLGVVTVIHPPIIMVKRAFKDGDTILPSKEYLERNHDIVEVADILIACPSGPEELRSGTWATIRYAMKRGVNTLILYP